jgi:hypothetical protein
MNLKQFHFFAMVLAMTVSVVAPAQSSNATNNGWVAVDDEEWNTVEDADQLPFDAASCLDSRQTALGGASHGIDVAELALLQTHRSSIDCLLAYPASWNAGCQAGTDDASLAKPACFATCEKMDWGFANDMLPPGVQYYKRVNDTWIRQ